jgi:predicted RNA-binding protein associated with RNAse of E/G family
VFSKLSAKEGLLIRIDDKLKRIKNGSLEKDDEDVVNDLIGYLVLLKIHAKFG